MFRFRMEGMVWAFSEELCIVLCISARTGSKGYQHQSTERNNRPAPLHRCTVRREREARRYHINGKANIGTVLGHARICSQLV